MRPEAVQLERDRIAATRRSNCDNMKILVNTENGYFFLFFLFPVFSFPFLSGVPKI